MGGCHYVEILQEYITSFAFPQQDFFLQSRRMNGGARRRRSGKISQRQRPRDARHAEETLGLDHEDEEEDNRDLFLDELDFGDEPDAALVGSIMDEIMSQADGQSSAFLTEMRDKIASEVTRAVKTKPPSVFVRLGIMTAKTPSLIDMEALAKEALMSFPVMATAVATICRTDDCQMIFVRLACLLKAGAQRCSGFALVSSCALTLKGVGRGGFDAIRHLTGLVFSHQHFVTYLRSRAKDWVSHVCWRIILKLIENWSDNPKFELLFAWVYDNYMLKAEGTGFIGTVGDFMREFCWTSTMLVSVKSNVKSNYDTVAPPFNAFTDLIGTLLPSPDDLNQTDEGRFLRCGFSF